MEVAGQVVGDQLGQRTCQLDSGRTAPDEEDGEVAVGGLSRLGSGVGPLEAGQHVVPEPEGVGKGLHGKRVLSDARDAEVAGR